MHKKVWEASGHLKSFVDPITQCKKCHAFYRADNLIQEVTGRFVEGLNEEELTKIIRDEKIKCPKCKGELREVRIFNLMLSSTVGPVAGNLAYLRPETAQGIFVNFKNILVATRASLPFGIAQIGRSYRNEISPRQWITRLREFNQMEIEMFFNPKEAENVPNFENFANIELPIFTREAQKKGGEPIKIFAGDAVSKGLLPTKFLAYFLAKEYVWYQKLGIPAEAIRFRHMLPEETPHYSKGNFDLEIKFDFGWKEVVGNAYRTDFDLTTHMKNSGKDFSVVIDGEKIIPHVVEPSFGLERTFYAVLLYCFIEDKERGWNWFKFPPKIAPYTAGIFPLVNKDGLPEKAKEIYNILRKHFDCFYDEKGSIGRRYARADELGTLVSITCDYQTLEDDTVTIRDRDTTHQIRVPIKKLKDVLEKLIEGISFEKLEKKNK
jgi:glycyl-tRNA synthetase